MLLVRLEIHEGPQFLRLAEPNAHQPALAVGRRVDRFGLVGELVVDRRHLPRERGQQVGHRLDGFDAPEGIPPFERRSGLRQLHEHHIGELLLRMVGDPDSGFVAFHRHPQVVCRVLQRLLTHTAFLPDTMSRPRDVGPGALRGRTPSPRGRAALRPGCPDPARRPLPSGGASPKELGRPYPDAGGGRRGAFPTLPARAGFVKAAGGTRIPTRTLTKMPPFGKLSA